MSTVHWNDLRRLVYEARKTRGLTVQACAKEIGIGTNALLKLCKRPGSEAPTMAAKWLGLELVGRPEPSPPCAHEWQEWMCGCTFGCECCEYGRKCTKCGKLAKGA